MSSLTYGSSGNLEDEKYSESSSGISSLPLPCGSKTSRVLPKLPQPKLILENRPKVVMNIHDEDSGSEEGVVLLFDI